MTNMKWCCRHCCFGANINLNTRKGSLLGAMYVCYDCGIRGHMCDVDAPIMLTEETYDKYWKELQTDCTFLPPEYDKPETPYDEGEEYTLTFEQIQAILTS